MTARIGCCGWAQAQAKYFAEFPVIEIQSTFYHPPAARVAAKWRALAPPGFEFLIKAWQLITHTPSSPTYRRLRSPVTPLESDLLGSFQDTEPVWKAWEKTREIAAAVQASVILFQCPASFRPFTQNLKNFSTFFEKLGPQTSRLAWEPRGDWPPELIDDLCVEYNLIHCVDPFVSQSEYGDPIYWRLHGKGGYSYRYTDQDLQELHGMIARTRRAQPAYVLFNNMSMRDDAKRFEKILAGPTD